MPPCKVFKKVFKKIICMFFYNYSYISTFKSDLMEKNPGIEVGYIQADLYIYVVIQVRL